MILKKTEFLKKKHENKMKTNEKWKNKHEKSISKKITKKDQQLC